VAVVGVADGAALGKLVGIPLVGTNVGEIEGRALGLDVPVKAIASRLVTRPDPVLTTTALYAPPLFAFRPDDTTSTESCVWLTMAASAPSRVTDVMGSPLDSRQPEMRMAVLLPASTTDGLTEEMIPPVNAVSAQDTPTCRVRFIVSALLLASTVPVGYPPTDTSGLDK